MSSVRTHFNAVEEQWFEDVAQFHGFNYKAMTNLDKTMLLREQKDCPDCTEWLIDPDECGYCGWFEGQDEDDGDAFEEARHMAGMSGGNRGLADFGGLDLDDDDRFGGDDE